MDSKTKSDFLPCLTKIQGLFSYAPWEISQRLLFHGNELSFPSGLIALVFQRTEHTGSQTNRGFTNPFTTGLYHKLSLAGNGAQL